MTSKIGPVTALKWLTLVPSLLLASGCEQQEFRMPPYVVEKDCEFTLVLSPDESASTTVTKGNTMVTMTLSMGPYQVDISDCEVVDNPNGLPVYSD